MQCVVVSLWEISTRNNGSVMINLSARVLIRTRNIFYFTYSRTNIGIILNANLSTPFAFIFHK